MSEDQCWRTVVGPKQVNIVGGKNHGKTALMVDLVSELKRRGIAVGSVKHCVHVHLLEPQTKDSARHREAGATPTAIVTPEVTAAFLTDRTGESGLDALTPLFRDCQVVLVEGLARVPHPFKLEIFTPQLAGEPLARTIADIRAVVTDPANTPDLEVPCWNRHDVPKIADRILDWVGA